MPKLLTLLLLVLAARAYGGEPLELNDQNILLAAMGALPDFDYAAQARVMLEGRNRQAWQALSAETRAQAVEEKARELRLAVAEIDEDTQWVLRDVTRVSGYDRETRRADAIGVVKAYEMVGVRAARDRDQLPVALALVVTNVELQRSIPLSPDEAQRLGLLGGGRTALEMELLLTLHGLKQGQNLIAVINEVRVFERGSEQPLAVLRARPRPGRILARSPLREGLTLDLVPNHSLDVVGGRLLDPLEPSLPHRSCKERDRVDGHIVVRCSGESRRFGFPMQLIQWYLGGRLVETRFLAGAVPEEGQLAKVERYLRGELRRTAEQARWTSRGAQVRYQRDRLVAAGEGRSEPFLVIRAAPATERYPGLRTDNDALELDAPANRS